MFIMASLISYSKGATASPPPFLAFSNVFFLVNYCNEVIRYFSVLSGTFVILMKHIFHQKLRMRWNSKIKRNQNFRIICRKWFLLMYQAVQSSYSSYNTFVTLIQTKPFEAFTLVNQRCGSPFA